MLCPKCNMPQTNTPHELETNTVQLTSKQYDMCTRQRPCNRRKQARKHCTYMTAGILKNRHFGAPEKFVFWKPSPFPIRASVQIGESLSSTAWETANACTSKADPQGVDDSVRHSYMYPTGTGSMFLSGHISQGFPKDYVEDMFS